jgi:hypothetical protein
LDRRVASLRLLDRVSAELDPSKMAAREAARADLAHLASTELSSPHSIAQSVAAMRAGFRSCFQEQLGRTPGVNLAGSVKFSVEAVGKVGKTEVEGLPSEMVPCIEGVVRTGHFSPPGRPQIVKVPLKFVTAASDSNPKPCLPYEPAVVSLRGFLERRDYPGPPNYESIRGGDRKETAWLLRVEKPTCTQASNDPLNPERLGINLVQLVLPDGGYTQYASLVQRHVVATGQLFGAHTGHHHTDVLLSVSSLTPEPQQ